MAAVKYEIVEHDGGWAYKVGQTYSETFQTKDEASRAAHRAADEQQVAGVTEGIRYEDAQGQWHDEVAEGGDRPQATVEDEP
jgi:hypothetical protein